MWSGTDGIHRHVMEPEEEKKAGSNVADAGLYAIMEEVQMLSMVLGTTIWESRPERAGT